MCAAYSSHSIAYSGKDRNTSNTVLNTSGLWGEATPFLGYLQNTEYDDSLFCFHRDDLPVLELC